MEVGPGPGTGTLAWRNVHKNDIEHVEEYTVVTPLTKIAKQLLQSEKEGVQSMKIRKELPSPMDPDGNNFDVVLCMHGISDISAPTRSLRYAHDDLVRDLWERVSPYGGVLVLMERGTPGGFEVVGRARDVVLRTIRIEPIPIEDEKAAIMRRDLETLFNRIYGRQAIEDELRNLQQMLDEQPKYEEEEILGDQVDLFEAKETLSQEDMVEELRELNELTDPFEIVAKVERLAQSPIRMGRALRVVIKEETEAAVEMINKHAKPLGRGRKRTRAEQEEIDALEQTQSERIQKLEKLGDYVKSKIKERKLEEEERLERLQTRERTSSYTYRRNILLAVSRYPSYAANHPSRRRSHSTTSINSLLRSS